MAFRFKHLASRPGLVASGWLPALGLALVAWCNPVHAGSAHRHAGRASAPAAFPRHVPHDPATLIGPPAPLGILFAPEMMGPATGGLRYEIEGPSSPTPATRLQPVLGTRPRLVWDPEIQLQLREVPTPGGGFMVDLLGAYLDLAILTIGDDGRPVLECAQQPPAPARKAPRPRSGKE